MPFAITLIRREQTALLLTGAHRQELPGGGKFPPARIRAQSKKLIIFRELADGPAFASQRPATCNRQRRRRFCMYRGVGHVSVGQFIGQQ
ncbi:MAG TPA: hypothetical protein VE396_13295 [Xanthobacteraceae bacterium]|nr:hypothetical protein [Xanthobacteraceae bacterium]